MPDEFAHVVDFFHDRETDEHLIFGWFGELAAARGSSGFGANPISFAELAAWAHLTDRAPTPFEISLLRRIDSAFLAVMSEPEDE